jgi:hypothetical protein
MRRTGRNSIREGKLQQNCRCAKDITKAQKEWERHDNKPLFGLKCE